MKPLEGVKVLELARILAGPWIGQLLADLGADVVKVERAGAGDDTRGWGPPFIEGADGENLSAAYFHSANRGKRSVEADFETPDGQALVRKLAAHADVVVENFKVGGLAKYGLDAESLRALNPRLVYCSVTGFGQTGPYAPLAGYDFMIQGMAGVMDLTGSPQGPPMKAGYATADIFCGLYAAVGILAALRRRDETGEGATLDMALMDAQVAVLGYQAINYFVSGVVPKRLGNGHPNIVPYDTFPVADGTVILAVGNNAQFAKLCEALGAEDLRDHPDYATNEGRVRNRAVLVPELGRRTMKFERDDLLDKLGRLKVPAGPVNSIADVFADPQVLERGLRVDLAAPEAKAGAIPTLRSPVVIDGEAMVASRPSPKLGAHTQEVLADPAWGG
ncbi:MAG TPA: CaiB/BaiF CoA-transferase family protein [Beijerinckiaceae bacterium]|jgi:crotonobetainyl-CoA:carnitine CoA-transferase CaiB-like acyl-CoA transferase|nr:CoA transferase [Microvirga sp.]HZB38940.1 CaiB/BaiF CoA-transferase family protein [Beijerinckiaceae bacterium]